MGGWKKQISAEEDRVEKQEGKTEYYHKQPEFSPDSPLTSASQSPVFMASAKGEELMTGHRWSPGGPGQSIPGQVLDHPRNEQPQSSQDHDDHQNTQRKWIFQAKVEHCEYYGPALWGGWLSDPPLTRRTCSKFWLSSWCFYSWPTSWPMEGMRSPSFQGPCSNFLGGRERKPHCRRPLRSMCPPELQLFSQPFPTMPMSYPG